MAKTIVGLYDDFNTAQQVLQDLVNVGIARENISLVASDATGEYSQQFGTTEGEAADVGTGAGVGAGVGAVLGGIGGLLVGLGALAIPGIGPVIAAGPLITALAGAGIGAVAGGLVGALTEMGVPEEEAQYYAEGVRRGGTLVTVNTADDMANQVRDIMNRYNPIDVDERSSEWRASGWTGFDADAQPSTTREQSRDRLFYTSPEDRRTTDEAKMDVVEEELAVGKHQVGRGGVRIHTHVSETPVEETVRLRQENVDVERRPVDRPATDADFAFEEGTVEVTATGEEAVVGKRARVVEEVVVYKDVEERDETIRDTVRRKDVDVENVGSTSTGYSDYTVYDTDFRRHFDTNFANRGYTYDQYSPAYRYGYDLAYDDMYRGYTWEELEPEAQRYWMEEHEGAWENFKDAVRHAWERTKDTLDMDDETSYDASRRSSSTRSQF